MEEGKDSAAAAKRANQYRVLPTLRLLQFLLVFLGLGVVFSIVSMYMTRYFGVQNVVPVAVTHSKVLPCFQEPKNSLERWIRPPSNLLHKMNDSQLFWRASFVPQIKEYPFKRVPKIAFMFLTRGPLPLSPLWERFFKGHEGLYSIYIHSLPSYEPDFPPLSVFYRRQIPGQVYTITIFSLICCQTEFCQFFLLVSMKIEFIHLFLSIICICSCYIYFGSNFLLLSCKYCFKNF